MVTHQRTVSQPSPHAIAAPQRHAAQLLFHLWSHAAARWSATVTVSILSGLLIALVMPRGPITPNQALILLLTGFVTGVVTGVLLHSRLAMLLAPALHLMAFELVRIGENGPSVDAIHLDTAFGIIGLLVGRGVYLIVGLFPMVLGAAYGASIARRMAGLPVNHRRGFSWYVRRAGGTVSTVAMAALAVWLALPASVPAVRGPDGEPVEGGIAELTAIQLGGHEQWIEIRGANPENPVILYLNGGPGQSDLALSRALLAPLHNDFTVVGWDQRGAGKSYSSLDADTLTLESVVADTIELTNYLRDRFDEAKIFLLTESWGSVPGVLAVQQHPELYYAYIGSGQMVDLRETDRMIYEDLLSWAAEHGDGDLAETLRGFGPPPYEDIWAYAFVMQHYDKLEGEYDPPQAYTDRYKESGVGFWGMLGSEYTLIDKANVFRGLLDMASVMYPQLQDVNFREQVPSLNVPVYLFDGEHELRGRRELSHQWFSLLDAPTKRMITYADAGHAPAFEHADDLHRILVGEILPQVYPGA